MELEHGKRFTTYDLLQAQFTGIIPVVDDAEESEVDFADQQLFEPYPFPDKAVKAEPTPKEKIEKAIVDDNLEAFENPERNENSGAVLNGEVLQNDKLKTKFLKNFNLAERRLVSKTFNTNSLKHRQKLKRAHSKMLLCKCGSKVHPKDMRVHQKYLCGKEDGNKRWVLKGGRAQCLKCNKLILSDTIDFHIKYMCGRKLVVPIQCLYCHTVKRNLRSVITHMVSHNKTHFFNDFEGILPKREEVPKKSKLMNNHNKMGGNGKDSNNVVKHPFIYFPPAADKDKSEGSPKKFPIEEDFFECLYCSDRFKAGYKALHHMDDVHGKPHNLYDLIRAKMAATGSKKPL